VRSPSNRAWHEPGAADLRDRVLSRDHGCVVCGATENLTVHHLIAVSDGGGNEPTNLAVVCQRHHDAIHRGEIELAKPIP
jgi:5-methylcytosine-specific restriction endonuclease McrA